MTRIAKSEKPKKCTRKVLTQVEKLDGYFTGIATCARMLLDRGVTVAETAQILREKFQAPLTDSGVQRFRAGRWKPQKERAEMTFTTLQALFTEAGGNLGLDLAAFARVRELLESSDIKDANAIRLAVLKIRAQDLKEEEFKFKAGRQAEDAQEKEADPAAQEDKRRRVMNKIRAIFALPPLPEGEDEAPAETETQEDPSEIESPAPAASEGPAAEFEEGQ